MTGVCTDSFAVMQLPSVTHIQCHFYDAEGFVTVSKWLARDQVRYACLSRVIYTEDTPSLPAKFIMGADGAVPIALHRHKYSQLSRCDHLFKPCDHLFTTGR